MHLTGMKSTTGIRNQKSREKVVMVENALEWTGRLGNIRACAREIVEKEIIFA